MSVRQPQTTAPENGFGDRFDRYSQYLEADCPECSESGIDVWITEGATAVRGVCVASGHVLDRAVVESLDGGSR